jgi:hypothetical protein
MKEFSSQTGGRYTYVEDFLNLQDLALAFSNLFSGCENFIVSGCTVKSNAISSGCVYINGKLRNFGGATGITKFPQYIYESNSTEPVTYASGGGKVGRNVYGCAISSSVPTSKDTLTGAVPTYIKITADGGLSIGDALFGRYALLLSPASAKQAVTGTVSFSDLVSLVNSTHSGKANFTNGGNSGSVYCNGDSMVIESKGSDGHTSQAVISKSGTFTISYDGAQIFKVTEDGITTSQLTCDKALIGNIVITGDSINIPSTLSEATLLVNMSDVGYKRNIKIGDGNGNMLAYLDGANNLSVFYTGLQVETSASESVVIKSTRSKSESSLLSRVVWKDKNGDIAAQVGYLSETSQTFSFVNNISSIEIIAADSVNIGPKIKEGGVLLSDKYVLKDTYNSDMSKVALADNVYTKTASDGKYSLLDGGLEQFIVGNRTAEKLCNEIGATTTEAAKDFMSKKALLTDIAANDITRKQICKNIGAVHTSDLPVEYDTGWVALNDDETLFVRQIGSVVSIQGTVKRSNNATVTPLFTLPDSISAPKIDYRFIGWSYYQPYGVTWMSIESESKKCLLDDYTAIDGNRSVSISITYMAN